MLKQLYALIQREPAVVAYGVVAALIPAAAAIWHWDATQTGAAGAIATTVATVIAAFHARPVSVSIITGGAAAIATALGAWKLTIPAADMALITSAISVLLGQQMRTNLTPVVNQPGVA